ncbi:MAG: SynChlorMet cassette protein ScmC, partial [Methanoregulaceae archaeon]|nr:SynChlorMet cassette protein ScmC [Methanoregulaceae archaeon]
MHWTIRISQDLQAWGEKFAPILGINEYSGDNRYQLSVCSGREAQAARAAFGGKEQDPLSIRDVKIYQEPRETLVVLPLTTREDLGIIHMMIALFPVYLQVIKDGGLPLHGAILKHPEYGGIGILAPGGTGKTTCSQRVIAPWSSPCDDFFVVIRSRQGYLAHPFPTWSEFLDEQKRRSGPGSWDSQDCTPLKGMYFLQKGKEDDCSVLDRIDAR